jgi:hypothetical protein
MAEVEVFIDGEKAWASVRNAEFTHVSIKIDGEIRLSYEKEGK